MLLTIQFYLSRYCQLGCLLLSISTVALAANEQPAAIGLLPDIKNDYLLFMAGRQPADIDYYGGPHARRDVAELVLLQQALDLGGFKQRIVFIEEENYFRSIRNTVEGKTLTMGGTIWLQDLDEVKEKVFISQALVRDGEFIVGLYTSPRNRKALASKALAELTPLRVVSSRQWKPDLRALESLGFQHIMYTPNWVNMVRMINAGRVDLTLAPFGLQDNMHISVEGIDLAPVPGIKIMIPGSRHWPVSRKHPLGQEFYTALEKGLQQLRAQGRIERAYRECGFFHSAVTDWVLLNQQVTD
jgi:hypothetical protein